MKINNEWQVVRGSDNCIPNEWADAINSKNYVRKTPGMAIYEGYGKRNSLARTWNEIIESNFEVQINTPRQPSIDECWISAESSMTIQDDEPLRPDEPLFTRRQRLARSVINGMQGGGLSLIPAMTLDKLWLTSAYPMVGLPMVGAAAVAGVGYGVYKTRTRTESEQPTNAEISANHLSNEQIEMLQNIYQNAAHTAGDIKNLSIGDESMSDKFYESLAVVPGTSQYVKISSVLKWIDQSAHQRAQRKPLESTGDFGRASELLANGANELYYHEMNESCGLPTVAKRTPLSLLALVRMKRRGEFVTKYQSEFQKTTEMIDVIKQKYIQIQDVEMAQIAINNESEYFRLQADGLRRDATAIMSEVALMDLRLAALAYVYNQNSDDAGKRYTPLETERVREECIEQWQQSINELCQMPFDGLSDDMAEVLIAALQLCRERINEPGDFGAATQHVVEYVKSIAGYVQDQGAAIEAIRKINTLLA